MRRVAIAGTGTGVGKTYITARLRLALAANAPVVALKPVESGYDRSNSDARAIGGGAWLEPLYRFEAPLSPHLAARLEGREVDLRRVLGWVSANASDAEVVLIETAGGLFSPLTSSGHTNVELLAELQPQAWFLVAPNRLGVLHDVGAVLAGIERRLSPPTAIILNAVAPDASSASNVMEMARLHPATPVLSTQESGDMPAALVALATGKTSPQPAAD